MYKYTVAVHVVGGVVRTYVYILVLCSFGWVDHITFTRTHTCGINLQGSKAFVGLPHSIHVPPGVSSIIIEYCGTFLALSPGSLIF